MLTYLDPTTFNKMTSLQQLGLAKNLLTSLKLIPLFAREEIRPDKTILIGIICYFDFLFYRIQLTEKYLPSDRFLVATLEVD